MSILSSLAFYFAYIFIRVMSFSFNFFMFYDLSVNFVIPLYRMYVFSVYFVFYKFWCLSFFLTFLLTCSAELRLFRISTND